MTEQTIGVPVPAIPGHPPHLAHHFDDLEQQKETATLGMWVFLTTEVMLFGGIFLGYISLRYNHYNGFAEASSRLYVSLGTINTVVLLGSSLTVALAVRAAQHGHGKAVAWLMVITLVLGAVFLGIKFTEYLLDYREGLIPLGEWWHPKESFTHPATAKLFMVFYFILTLLHAIHMTIGMVVLAVIGWYAGRGTFTTDYYNPVEISGLYWHFVDIVWVFLFPTLYLINPH